MLYRRCACGWSLCHLLKSSRNTNTNSHQQQPSPASTSLAGWPSSCVPAYAPLRTLHGYLPVCVLDWLAWNKHRFLQHGCGMYWLSVVGDLDTNVLCRATSASKCISRFDSSALLVGSLSNRVWCLPIVSPVLWIVCLDLAHLFVETPCVIRNSYELPRYGLGVEIRGESGLFPTQRWCWNLLLRSAPATATATANVIINIVNVIVNMAVFM